MRQTNSQQECNF